MQNPEPTLAQRLKDLSENPTILAFYVKRNCKSCLGRGNITRSIPTGNGGWEDQITMCDCVIKAVKKEMANG